MNIIHKPYALVMLFTGSIGLMSVIQSQAQTDPSAWLLDQIHLGEMLHQEDLVSNSLYRLKKIDSNNPRLLVAEIQLALRQQHLEEAQKLLGQLRQIAPQAESVQQMTRLIALQQPSIRQQVQRARLAAIGGRYQDAWQIYHTVWQDQPPTADDAVEYWRVAARLPGQQQQGLQHLVELLKQEPRNLLAWQGLINAYFEFGQTPKAFDLLDQMASDPLLRAEAAKLWWPRIRNFPATDIYRTDLKNFTVRFVNLPEEKDAQQLLASYDKQLADPNYRAKLHGLELVTRNAGLKAIPDLQKALVATPDDPILYGSLGRAYQQAGNRAKANDYYLKAIELDKGVTHQEWVDLQRSNQYWWLLDQASELLKKQQFVEAQRKYQTALPMDAKDPYALIGLGDVAVALKQSAMAERDYRRAIARDPKNIDAQRALLNLYLTQNNQRAEKYLASLSPALQKQFQDLAKQLKLTHLRTAAQKAQQQHQDKLELSLLTQLYQLDPSDIWVVYRMAQLLVADGHQADADSLYQHAVPQCSDPAAAHYAYALYLSATDRNTQASSQLALVPRSQWSDGMRNLDQRLRNEAAIAYARKLQAQGHLTAADQRLQSLGNQPDILLLRADWQAAAKNDVRALALYDAVLQQQPKNAEARLGKANVLISMGPSTAASEELRLIDTKTVREKMTIAQLRVLGNDWMTLKEYDRAKTAFDELRLRLTQAPMDQETALAWRDTARATVRRWDQTQALLESGNAMVAAGLAHPSMSAETMTAETQNNPKDDWLERSIRADYAQLYQQQTTSVTLAQDISRSSGTDGYSSNTTNTTMLQLDQPFGNTGHSFFRMDYVAVDAGSFSGNPDGDFGSCDAAETVCDDIEHQKATGTSFAYGVDLPDDWSADIGTTPLGFDQTTWVGRAGITRSLWDVKWTPYVSRRPMTNSLLSFAGTKDPVTNKEWGGVIANNIGVDLSYDQGGADGLWGSLKVGNLKGENVASNQREQWMGGYYYKLINQSNARLSVGVSNMLWHYQKDLSDYTWGNGGYYSPQHYLSFGLPVTYAKRMQDWSVQISSSLSHSWSETSSQSQSWGYSTELLGEYRVTPHWFVGVKTTFQHSPDYSPAYGLFYIRYALQGWQGDLNLPPQPLTPYAAFE